MPRGLLRWNPGRMDETFGLIDCNDFYVSCERVFPPDSVKGMCRRRREGAWASS